MKLQRSARGPVFSLFLLLAVFLPDTARAADPPAATQPTTAPAREQSIYIPYEKLRQVFERDGGCCTWVGEDGRRCGSRFQVEVDHVTPPRFGGRATLDDLRLLCRPHNRR